MNYNVIGYFKHGLDFINIINSNKIVKNDFLDPFAVIIILGLVSYYPIGTKIAIHNNRVYIQANDIFQGIQRYMYGDKKTDINILFGPILYSINYYMNADKKDKYIPLFKRALLGLANLKKTYITKDIVYSISRLMDLVQYGISNVKNILKDEELEYSQIDKIKNQIYDEFNKVWEEKHFTIILQLFDDISQKGENSKTNLLLCIEYYIRDIESDLIEKINNIIN